MSDTRRVPSGGAAQPCDLLYYDGNAWRGASRDALKIGTVKRVCAGKGIQMHDRSGHPVPCIDRDGVISTRPLENAVAGTFCPARVVIDECGRIAEVGACEQEGCAETLVIGGRDAVVENARCDEVLSNALFVTNDQRDTLPSINALHATARGAVVWSETNDVGRVSAMALHPDNGRLYSCILASPNAQSRLRVQDPYTFKWIYAQISYIDYNRNQPTTFALTSDDIQFAQTTTPSVLITSRPLDSQGLPPAIVAGIYRERVDRLTEQHTMEMVAMASVPTGRVLVFTCETDGTDSVLRLFEMTQFRPIVMSQVGQSVLVGVASCPFLGTASYDPCSERVVMIDSTADSGRGALVAMPVPPAGASGWDVVAQLSPFAPLPTQILDVHTVSALLFRPASACQYTVHVPPPAITACCEMTPFDFWSYHVADGVPITAPTGLSYNRPQGLVHWQVVPRSRVYVTQCETTSRGGGAVTLSDALHVIVASGSETVVDMEWHMHYAFDGEGQVVQNIDTANPAIVAHTTVHVGAGETVHACVHFFAPSVVVPGRCNQARMQFSLQSQTGGGTLGITANTLCLTSPACDARSMPGVSNVSLLSIYGVIEPLTYLYIRPEQASDFFTNIDASTTFEASGLPHHRVTMLPDGTFVLVGTPTSSEYSSGTFWLTAVTADGCRLTREVRYRIDIDRSDSD